MKWPLISHTSKHFLFTVHCQGLSMQLSVTCILNHCGRLLDPIIWKTGRLSHSFAQPLGYHFFNLMLIIFDDSSPSINTPSWQIYHIWQTIETVVDAHLTTCNYTADKVAAGVKKYETMMSSGKMPMMVSYVLYVIEKCLQLFVLNLLKVHCIWLKFCNY